MYITEIYRYEEHFIYPRPYMLERSSKSFSDNIVHVRTEQNYLFTAHFVPHKNSRRIRVKICENLKKKNETQCCQINIF